MSGAVRHQNDRPRGTTALPTDLTEDQLEAAPVLGALDQLLVEGLTDDEDEAFAAAIDA